MPTQWTLILGIPLLALVIPAAILAGHRMPGGPILLTSGGALLAFAVFWSAGLTGGFSPGNTFNYSAFIVYIFVFFGGVILLLGAWALAFAGAMGERRWVWVALLNPAVYLTFVALVAILLSPYFSCMFQPQQPYCQSANASVWKSFITASFIGPVAVLLYALRPNFARRSGLPAGMRATPLGAPDAADTAVEPNPR
jgi:hypothetical protein